MCRPSIEDIEQLCADHGWRSCGNNGDMLRWLRTRLEAIAEVGTLEDDGFGNVWIETEESDCLDCQGWAKEREGLVAEVAVLKQRLSDVKNSLRELTAE
jgi:hypothetical protein